MQSNIDQLESTLDSVACELLQHATPETAELYYIFSRALQSDLRAKFGDVFENFRAPDTAAPDTAAPDTAAAPFVENVPAAAAAVLLFKNWTGHTLADLIHAGRIDAADRETVRQFVRAALGNAATLAEVRNQETITNYISTL